MSKVGVNLVELSKTIAARGARWEAGDTSMTALPIEEAKKRLGFTPPPGTPTLEEIASKLAANPPKEAFMAAAAIGAPSSFDHRNINGQSYVSAVRNQGSCGSCVSFGVGAVLETTLRRTAGDPSLDVDVSEAHIFYCHGRAAGRNCSNGWWPDAALDACHDKGVALESRYPYTAGDQDCTGLDGDWRRRFVSVAGRRALSGAAIKEWIATRGPVTGCFIVYDDFFAYRSGVYRHVSGGQAGGHCVAIIGYDDAESCWICKNSWGSGWGDGGYFRIAYGECGIDTWAGPYGAEGVAFAEEGAPAWSGWHSQSGVLTSDIAVATNFDGRLEVFVRGTDGAVWHKWQTSPSGGWSDWSSLGGVITSNISVGTNLDGRLEIFARGTDMALYHQWQDSPGGGWSGWHSLGGVITSDPVVARNADGRLEVFARGTDNAVWHRWQDSPGGGWSGWASEGGVITSNIAVGSNHDGRLEIFARGTDNAVWHKWQETPNGGWSGWASEGGVITSNIAVGSNHDGRLEIFARGTDNAVWHKWQETPSGGWSGWASEGGGITSDIAIGRSPTGRLEAFVRGTDNAVWHKWQETPSGGWSGWASEGGVITSNIGVGTNGDGRLEIFVRGTDGALWHDWQNQVFAMPRAAAERAASATGGMPAGLMSEERGMPSGRMGNGASSMGPGVPAAGMPSAATAAATMPSGAMGTLSGSSMPAGRMNKDKDKGKSKSKSATNGCAECGTQTGKLMVAAT